MAEAGSIKSRLVGPALGMLAVALVLFASGIEIYQQIELKTLDMRFKMRPPLEQSPRILHVDIDDTSITAFGRWQSWSRDRHAHLISILKELGAKGVVFDIEFSESSTPEDDKKFADALKNTAFSILPVSLKRHEELTAKEKELQEQIRELLKKDFEANAVEIAGILDVPVADVIGPLASLKHGIAREAGLKILSETGSLTEQMLLDKLVPDNDPLVKAAERKRIIPAAVDHCLTRGVIYDRCTQPIPVNASESNFTQANEIVPPINVLARQATQFGATNAKPDEDGVLRHASLFLTYDGRIVPHLSLVTVCQMLDVDVKDVKITPGESVTLIPNNLAAGNKNPIVIPVDERCRTIVNWAGARSVPFISLFKHIPYGSILELHTLREDALSNDAVFAKLDEYGDVGAWIKAHEKVAELRWKSFLTHAQRKELETRMAAQLELEKIKLDYCRRKTRGITEAILKELPPKSQRQARDLMQGIKAIPLIWKNRPALAARESDLRQRLRKIVKDRLCVVGMTATASTDLKPTPLLSLFPGVGLHTAVINSILQRAFIHRAPQWVDLAAIIVIGLIISMMASYLDTRPSAIGTFVILGGWAALCCLVFRTWGLWLAMVGPLLSGFFAYAAITAYRQLTEERQKRHIRRTFQQYLSPTVVEEVLKNPDALKLGGERKDLTVFFSDVAGFTPISEMLEAEELVKLLNEYLSEMSDVILDSKGYINKYVGDAVMGVFGAPLPDPDHAATACAVALESKRRLTEFRKQLIADGRPPIFSRIGVNSGIMIVGNMGSHKLFDYTVMGDNVNVGARLEAAGKQFGTEIIIGEATRAAVGDKFETRSLGRIHVKGRKQPVGAYELLGEKGSIPPDVEAILDDYNLGLSHYIDRRWDDAIAAFTRCLEKTSNDGPADAYLKRCQLLRNQPLSDDWDGAFSLT